MSLCQRRGSVKVINLNRGYPCNKTKGDTIVAFSLHLVFTEACFNNSRTVLLMCCVVRNLTAVLERLNARSQQKNYFRLKVKNTVMPGRNANQFAVSLTQYLSLSHTCLLYTSRCV